jgi:myosin-crossreactive antigen
MKWLCRHLGHTRKVHEQHYRATSGLIERLDIAKLMLLQEGNLQGKFHGKALKEINFEGNFFFHSFWVYRNDCFIFVRCWL